MKHITFTWTLRILLSLAVISLNFNTDAQISYCDSTVPTMNVDLSGSPTMTWVSPLMQRDGSCCGAVSPDVCLEFVITLHPSTIAVNFNIASGAAPPGALYYQIDCGPITPVGSPICLSGAGPHHLTFCKPGNNSNTFSIETYTNPIVGPDITLNAGCEGFMYGNYYNEPSIQWTSIGPGAPGAYDYLLSCTSGCDTTYLTAPVSAPPYVDYLICGMDLPDCNPNPICDTVRVNFVPPVEVVISSTQTSLCTGDVATLTATASGGSAPYSFVWNTGATSGSIVGGPGTYFVEVLDNSLCHVATDTLVIVENILPPVVAGPDIAVCDGESVTLSGSGAVTYSWNNGVVDGVSFVPGVGSSTYTVTGTDANGCQNVDDVVVTVNPLPAVSAGLDQTVCDGESVELIGSGATTYTWTGGVTNNVAFVPPVGSTNYTVTGTDANGCVNVDEVTVLVHPLPVVNAGQDLEICVGETIQLNATGPGGATYTWGNGMSNNASVSPGVGTHSYAVTCVDVNGCTNTDEFTVVVNPLPAVNGGQDIVICDGMTVTLNASGASSYSWSGGIVNGGAFEPSVGQHQFVVTGTDGNSCSNTDTVLVTVNPNPVVVAGPDITVCEDVYITLNATGTEGFTWDNGVQNNVPFIQPVGTVMYIVSNILPTGCSAFDTVYVEVMPNPIVSSIDVVICEGEAVQLFGNGADNYQWTGGVIDGVPFYPSVSDTFMVTGIGANGCVDQAYAAVTVHPAPIADFTIMNLPLSTLDPTTGFDNTSIGATSYLWDFGDGSFTSTVFEPMHTYPDNESGEYAITLIAYSDEGCSSTKVKYIHVFQDFTIYVPNAFTPDYDDYNQTFKPVMEGFDENKYTMVIYNRWGELIFETHNMDIGWDGTYAGQDFQVQDGTFTWKITAGLKDSPDSKVFIGHVSILK